MDRMMIANIEAKLNNMQQRIVILQNQLSQLPQQNKFDVLASRIVKLEIDLKSTTAAVMLLRSQLIKYQHMIDNGIDMNELKKFINQLKVIVNDPEHSVFFTASSLIPTGDEEKPYELNPNAKIEWDNSDSTNPTMNFINRNQQETISVDPNAEIITIGKTDPIVIDGANGIIKLDDTVEINNDGEIKLKLTDPSDSSRQETITLISSDNTWPIDYNKDSQTIFEYIKNASASSALEKTNPNDSTQTITWGSNGIETNSTINSNGLLTTSISSPSWININNDVVMKSGISNKVIYFEDTNAKASIINDKLVQGDAMKLDYETLVRLNNKLDSYYDIDLTQLDEHDKRKITLIRPGFKWNTYYNKPQLIFMDASESVPVLRSGDINTLKLTGAVNIKGNNQTEESIIVQLARGVEKALTQSVSLDALIDYIVTGEYFYGSSPSVGSPAKSIVPERYGTKSILGLIATNNHPASALTMPAVEFILDDTGKIVSGYVIETDSEGTLIHRDSGTNNTGSDYKWKIDCGNTYPTEVNVANYIYANIYNLKSCVKRYSQ